VFKWAVQESEEFHLGSDNTCTRGGCCRANEIVVRARREERHSDSVWNCLFAV